MTQMSGERNFFSSFIAKLRWRRLFGRRVLLGTGFALLLAYFLHFREVPTEMLGRYSTAERYVISQIDFEFPDEEATQMLKQEALRDIGTIYLIDPKQIQQKAGEIEQRLLKDTAWRKELHQTSFEELYRTAKGLSMLLFSSRFTDVRTLKKIANSRLALQHYHPLGDRYSLISTFILQKPFWDAAASRLAQQEKVPLEVVNAVIDCFSGQSWELGVDSAEDRLVRESVNSSCPIVYTHVPAGSTIIEPGEKVNARHLAMLKAMKRSLEEMRNLWTPLALFGNLMLAVLYTGLGSLYLKIYHRHILKSFQKLSLLIAILITTLILAKTLEFFLRIYDIQIIDVAHYPLFIPFAAILICVLVGSEVALIASAFLAIILQISLAMSAGGFLVINLIAALITLIGAHGIHKRTEIFLVCTKTWLCCVPVLAGLYLMHNDIWSLSLLEDLASTFFFMAATPFLVLAILPLFESFFHVMTDVTLMEYMDPNADLLRRLSLEAPGTYQHSLVVGTLSERSAVAIRANGLFCRAAALYHDVGKLFNPHYFTENQLGGLNIHQLLTPTESAQVILAHVSQGEMIARKYKLPQSFIDIIREHHGTTLPYYFYCRHLERLGGDTKKVDEKKFRYPGPKPRSKESAIIMIADCVEAASRTLEDVSEEALALLVERLVSEKIEQGQLDESHLTFEELGTVKRSMVTTLASARHLRIKYTTPLRQEILV